MSSKENRNSSEEEDTSSLSLELVVYKAQEEEKRPEMAQDKNMYDYDPETMKDKPWLKPGANISDYFNYGFTERTWMKYCEMQRENRDWAGRQGKFDRDGNDDRYPKRRRRHHDDEKYGRRQGRYR